MDTFWRPNDFECRQNDCWTVMLNFQATFYGICDWLCPCLGSLLLLRKPKQWKLCSSKQKETYPGAGIPIGTGIRPGKDMGGMWEAPKGTKLTKGPLILFAYKTNQHKHCCRLLFDPALGLHWMLVRNQGLHTVSTDTSLQDTTLHLQQVDRLQFQFKCGFCRGSQ